MQRKQSTFALAPLLGLLALAAPTSACDGDAPAEPTWINDVQPLVEGNCIRCHSYPARGGAPAGFRLDVYDSYELVDGTQIRGVGVMAEFMKQRAGTEGTMPPDFARGDVMRDTFKNWFTMGVTESPERGGHASNGDPVAVLLTELPDTVDDEVLELAYEVSDGDGDIVHGRFSINDGVTNVRFADLHSGRGTIKINTASLAEGDHEIIAEMTDGRTANVNRRGFINVYPVVRVMGTLQVEHADGNTAPRFQKVERLFTGIGKDAATLADPGLVGAGPFNHTLLADAQSPAIVSIELKDPNDTDTHQVSLVAFRGDEEVVVESQLAMATNPMNYEWDTTVMPEGPGWRLRLVATDSAGGSSTFETGTIHFSHHTTTETFADILPLLTANCGGCHLRHTELRDDETLDRWLEDIPIRGRVPGLNITFAGAVSDVLLDALVDNPTPDEDEVTELLIYAELQRKVGYNSGLMYMRVAEEKNMPPASTRGLGNPALSDENRARIADYLLGGAPKRAYFKPPN